MKKIIIYAFVILLICTLMFTFASCDDPKPTCPPHVDENSDGACDVCDKEIDPDVDPDDIPDLSGVTLEDASFVYDGEEHTLLVRGELPDGVVISYFGGNRIDVGEYEVSAKFFYEGKELADSELTAMLTIEKATINMMGVNATDITSVYNGTQQIPGLAGTLPKGVSVRYSYANSAGEAVDKILNVGEYKVTATFVYDTHNYNELAPMSFTYTVTPATYDMSGVRVLSVTKTYDGEEIVPTLTGTLPEGISHNFTIKNSLGETVEKIVDAGAYTVYATFSQNNDNYFPFDPISGTIVVEKSAIGGISFTDAVFAFDGAEKSIFVVGAPEWLEITYEGNGVTAPGTYTVTATFGENANYVQVPPMQAKIVIEIDKSTPTDGIVFEEYKDGYAVSGVKAGVSIVVIPATHEGNPVLSVKSFAFDGNEELTYVYVPSSVINIGNRAFADCKALATVEFGDVEVIGQQAFKNTAIKEISLPESLESIGFGAFEGTKLERITLPFVGGSRNSSSEYIGFIFGASSYAANTVKVPATLTSVTLSNGCKSVPARAFYGLTSLTEVVFGRSVGEIGIGAFEGCSSLRSVYIPASVTDIHAGGKVENAPFYGTCEDMMIVVESVGSAGAWGQYFAAIGEGKTALVIYNKTYDDYVMNKESYREFDPSDATLSTMFVGGAIFDKFDPSVYEYTLDADIKLALPEIGAMAAAPGATITIVPASASNGNVATVTVVSTNGEKTLVYKVKFNVTGSFNTSAEIVNKNGAKGTVTFVVDDGYVPTATFMKTMMEKYANLAVTYAVYTKNFLTTSSEYTTDNGLIIDDIDGDGMKEYVLDENGKYTYVRNEEVIDFWRDILSVGRSEIVAHSHTHAFWGVNDEGGAQLTASTAGKISTRIYSTLAEGSATKEVYASMQIIKDLFGDTSKGITYVNAGIPPKEGDTVVTEEVRVYLSKQTVRVLYDTKVTVTDGKVYLQDLTWVDLQSTVGTLPANTDVVTTADTSSGVLPAGTPIYLASDYVTVPTTDPDGNQNVVRGFKAYMNELYAQALADGTFIGARTSGQKVYTARDFLNEENRIFRRAYIIATTTNEARPESWKQHIDNAIAADGGWASFCIHAMTEDISEEGQGGHKITWEQAEDLFSYACGKGDDLWIATQTDATLYYHEWSTASVTASYDEATNAITVSLTDEERDDVYTMPLTIKVSIPGNWASVTVNGETLKIRTEDDGSTFVYVDVVPETTVSIIGG